MHLRDSVLTSQLGETATAVGMAGIAGEIHVVISTNPEAGPRTLHTIRRADGSWETLRIIDRQVKPPRPDFFMQLYCAGAAGQLHICGVTGEGNILHTIRYPDGTWQNHWDDLKAILQPPPTGGPYPRIQCAGNDAGELLVTYQAGPLGAETRVLYAFRNANGFWTAPSSMDYFAILEMF